MVKAEEDSIVSLSDPFPDYFSYSSSSSVLDMFYSNHHHHPLLVEAAEAEAEEEKRSFGFMELLGFQNMSPPSPCLLHPPNHHPTTPNSTSYYSSPAASTSPLNPNTEQEEEEEDHLQQKQTTSIVNQEDGIEEDDEQQQKLNKQELKPKKVTMSQKKKQREARIAFMTKSEVDHLEDGYRWRKYGQKAVKNSPFPRGYYRCTTAKCNVKKRVERCFNDPTTVITTYEGKHTHPTPASSFSPYPPNSASAAAAARSTAYPPGFFRTPTFLLPPPTAILQSQQDTGFNCRYLDGTTAYSEMETCSQTPPNSNYAFLADHGSFLQDIPPPGNDNFNTNTPPL